jgi:hypothetical protein
MQTLTIVSLLQYHALRVLNTFSNKTDEDDEMDETRTVQDCYTLMDLPFLASSPTAAARGSGVFAEKEDVSDDNFNLNSEDDDLSELGAEDNVTAWRCSPAPIEQDDMVMEYVHDLMQRYSHK